MVGFVQGIGLGETMRELWVDEGLEANIYKIDVHPQNRPGGKLPTQWTGDVILELNEWHLFVIQMRKSSHLSSQSQETIQLFNYSVLK